MQNINTSVIDRRVVITDDHFTFPFEVGWAREATWFVQVEGTHPTLGLQPQTSPDGINWVDHGDPSEHKTDAAISTLPVVHFGGWLRLIISGASADQPATILTHLVLKG